MLPAWYFNAPVICNHCVPPPPFLLLSSPAVPGKCQTCDTVQIYPSGIYYSKKQVCQDSQQVQLCRASSRALMDAKSLSPLFPVVGAAVVTNDWCINAYEQCHTKHIWAAAWQNWGSYASGKCQGIFYFSRSGNCQGISWCVREKWNFAKCQGIIGEFGYSSHEC